MKEIKDFVIFWLIIFGLFSFMPAIIGIIVGLIIGNVQIGIMTYLDSLLIEFWLFYIIWKVKWKSFVIRKTKYKMYEIIWSIKNKKNS